MEKVRTRLAPSPTGFMHIGLLRTAIFGWLFARQNNGQFILRIEDTDHKRYVEGSIEYIIYILKTLGLDYDEGPDKPGPFGPYIQSQRQSIYHQWIEKLIADKRAYLDPYSPEEIEQFRRQAIAQKKPFLYRNHRPINPTYKFKIGQAIRFKSEPQDYNWHDLVMGDLSAKQAAIDDFILIKSDGLPTYNFAHIIDDYLMEISHITRAVEFIASTPNFLNLYEALKIKPPKLVSCPHILDSSGHKKLSKRDTSQDSPNIANFIRDGYLNVPLINFLARLGWNDGSNNELYSIDELIKRFDISKIHRSGAKYDHKKLLFLNGLYIRGLTINELYTFSKNFFPVEANNYSESYRKQVLSLLQERLKYLAEIPEMSLFFFKEPEIQPSLIKDNKFLNTLEKTELVNIIKQTINQFEQLTDFSLDNIESCLNNLLVSLNRPPAVVFSLIRIATTQASYSPALAPSLKVLGQEVSLKRLKKQLINL